MSYSIAVLVTVLLAHAPLQGQGQVDTGRRMPDRDGTPSPKGTAVIRGRVTNVDGRPLRRVQIRLGGDAIPEGRSASSNGEGQFEIRDLPAGRVSLIASRAGYLSMSFGQTRPDEPGRPIELADGETVNHLELVLPRTSTITGRIVDEAGEPLAGATVMTMQMRFFNGRRRLLAVRGTTISDDTGQYRLSSLAPGEYYVQASSRETWETDPPQKQGMGFFPTFYPSSPNVTEAQRVRVRVGQEVAGIDIGLVPGKVGKISGTAFNSQGAPLTGETVNMVVQIRGENFMSMNGGQSTKVNPDGSFVFHNVAPGEYHLNVRTAADPSRPSEAANVVVSTVSGNQDGVSITTSASGALLGRITVDRNAKIPVPFTGLAVRAQAVDWDAAIVGGNAEYGRVGGDGTFELKPIFGPIRLTMGPLPDGWAIRSIEYNGRDMTSLPIDTQGQTIEGVTITLTAGFPSVSGTLRDAKGNPQTSGTILLFPLDASGWIEDLRTVHVARPDQAGVFSIKAVRPGEYLAVAVPHLTNNQWNDPEYLEGLRDRAIHVTVAEHRHQTVDVTIR